MAVDRSMLDTPTVRSFKQQLIRLADEYLLHDGWGHMEVDMRIMTRRQKEIISNCGLTPADVASPEQTAEEAVEEGRRYWLVAFGLGRFAEIYEGNGARVDTPVASKRYNSETIYSRYIVIVKIPTDAYDTMENPSGLRPQIACVLSPQGLSAASLTDTYRNDVKATEN